MKLTTTLYLICLPCILLSQRDFNLITGQIFKSKDKPVDSYFGNFEGDLYFAGSDQNKKDFIIYRFNNDLVLNSKKEVETDYKFYGWNSGFIKTSLEGNKLYFIHHNYTDKNSGTEDILERESIVLPDLKLEVVDFPVSDPIGVANVTMFSGGEMGQLLEAHSPDKSKTAFWVSTLNYSKENPEFQLMAVNELCSPIYKTIIKPNISASTYNRNHLAVSNDGIIYCLVAMTPEGKGLSEYRLSKYSSEGELVHQISFLPEGRLFSTPFLLTPEDGSLILCGFTSTKSNDEIDGLAMFRLSGDDMTATTVKYYNLPTEFEELSRHVKNGRIKGFGSAQCVMSADGSLTMAVEAKAATAKGVQRLLDLFAIKLDGDGNIVNTAVLLKEQIGESHASAGSFKLYSKDNDVFLFMNDHKKNADILPTEKPKDCATFDYLTMYLIRFSDHGFERVPLYDSSKEKLRTHLPHIYQTESGDFIFRELGLKESRLRMLKL